ncbi:winged helix-turn-helix domain-containing protein [Streptomyces sp. bgisy060]|uniref:winged helix-turn-helix domain-containing protein n=1 Tax=Streptomyces sp. bgisy060 TaxID=3413775 RepID=UPI003EBADC8E
MALSSATMLRLLTDRPGWSLQRPERRAVERDESEIARFPGRQNRHGCGRKGRGGSSADRHAPFDGEESGHRVNASSQQGRAKWSTAFPHRPVPPLTAPRWANCEIIT